MSQPVYDVVIVGGGHNGLVAAAYLAKAGLNVLVLERRQQLGGAAATEEIFPGYRVATCAFWLHVLHPRVAMDLDLSRHGLRVVPLDPTYFCPFPNGQYLYQWGDVARTQAEIARLSPHDAAAYPKWIQFWTVARSIFERYALADPPTIADLRRQPLNNEQSRTLRILTDSTIRQFMSELFESDEVQGALMSSVDIKSIDRPGDLLSWASVRSFIPSDEGLEGLPIGGMGAVSDAIARAALAAGARLRVGASVRRIITGGTGVAGVQLDDGQVIRARAVISNADPKTTFLDLLADGAVEASVRERVSALESESGSLKLHAAVSELPDFSGFLGAGYDPRSTAMIRLCPSPAYVEQTLADAAAGRPAANPVLIVQTATLHDPGAAPPGRHIVSIRATFEPVHPATGTWDDHRVTAGERVIDLLTEFAPNFRRSIIDWLVYTPADLRQRLNLTDGNIHHLNHTAGQLLADRLFPGGGHRTPLAGLYMCGAGTHPGGEVSGAPGYNAARALLSDLALQEGVGIGFKEVGGRHA